MSSWRKLPAASVMTAVSMWGAAPVADAMPAPALHAQRLADSVRICVRDAATAAPLVGATLRTLPGDRVFAMQGDCLRTARGRDSALVVSRLSYVPAVLSLRTGGDDVIVFLTSRVLLPTQRVVASREQNGAVGGTSASLTTEQARTRGITGMTGLLTQLPYTALRSARGETGLSLRGSRREQVVVTLDGLPLNDPSTGLADVSDLPLVAVQAVTVAPGSDPVGAGPGASGGVLALSTASQRMVSLRTGAFGSVGAEAAWTGRAHGLRWHAAAAHHEARNDFAFVNDAGAGPVAETRVNNDERRSSFLLGALAARAQLSVLASAGERGMVGAANVRTYDQDRSRTARLNIRSQFAIGSTVLIAGTRWFALDYRDPSRPALDARAQAWANDLEWRGAAAVGAWRAGLGADGLSGSGGVEQRRTRAFGAWSWQRAVRAESRLEADLGLRADVVERSGVQPSAGAGASWRVAGRREGSRLAVVARTSQAVRVPTLYDLYFSSPQRLFVRALRPERVTLDASLGVQGAMRRADATVTGELLAVSRDTRDAIIWFPGNFGWSPANVGRERLRGVEGRVDLVTSRLSAGLWSTWYASTLRTGGLTIPTPYVPQVSGGFRAQWHLDAGARTALSANTRLQGRRPFSAGPRNPLFELPAVTVVDAAVSHRLSVAHTDALLSVGLDNVTGTRWQSVRGFPMPGRAWSVALTVQPRP